jgi:hypothetical protein
MNPNGKPNGNGQQQINPIEAAQFALIFLGRATFTRQERQMFDVADALLNAIVSGQVQLASPPMPAQLVADASQQSEPLQ